VDDWPTAPPGVVVIEHGEGLEIRIPWRTDINIGTHIVTLGAAALFLGATVSGSDVGSVQGLLGILIAAALLGSWLYAMVNTTNVWIGAGGVAFSQGPLPSWRNDETFGASKVFPVTVLASEERGYRFRRTVYELHIGTSGKVPLAKWNYRAALDFVRDGIRRGVAQPEPSSH